jgi:hypothetical protein
MATKKVPVMILLAVVMFAAPVWAASDAHLTLRIYNAASVTDRTLADAEQQIQYIFRTAGISTNILNCRALAPANSSVALCPQSLGPNDLVIRLVPRGRSSSDTFGMAFLPAEGQGRYCDVFYEPVLRIRDSLATQTHLNEGRLLGHVIAHEVGHLLLGTHSHSQTGIMVAQWHPSELQKLSMGRLLFAPDQIQKLRDSASTLTVGLTGAEPLKRSSYPRSFSLSQIMDSPETN